MGHMVTIMGHVLKAPSSERKERFSLSSSSKKTKQNNPTSPIPPPPPPLNILKEEIQLAWLAMRLSVSQALWTRHGIWLARFQLGAHSWVYRGGYITRRSDTEMFTIFRTMDSHRIMFKLWIPFSYMSWLKTLEDQHYFSWNILVLLLYPLQI